jgi:putative ABC transport system permease protein
MFNKRRKPADFAAEIESHIAIEAERLRSEGLSASEARDAARQKFGNILHAKESFYESRRMMWLEDLQKDVRYAFRLLRHSPVFAFTVVLTLALAIGAAAAIFAVADAALLKPLPFPDARRLILLYERWQGDLDSLAPADFLDYQRQAQSFEELAAYRDDPFNLGGENRPERVWGAVVTPNFFSVFGVAAAAGRTLNREQDKPGEARTAVLSYSLWQRRYHASAQIIGQTIQVNGEPLTVVGVMPSFFTYPENTDIWASARYRVPEHPLRPLVDSSDSRSTHYFDIVGRLKPGVAIPQAQAEAEVIGRRLAKLDKDETGDGLQIVSLRTAIVGNTRPAILILIAAVAVLFLIACANVANIVLARGAARQNEIAMRRSLGARPFRLIRQLMVESLLLSLAGAALGAAAAAFTLRSLETLLPADLVPSSGLHIDARVLAFAVAAAALSTILFGLFPALQAVNMDLNSALKTGSRTGLGGSLSDRSRRALLMTQVALAAMLLIGAGLLIRSLDRLLSAPQGFRSDHLLTMQLSLPPAQYASPADRNRFANEVLSKIRSLPGVSSTGIVSRLPLNPGTSHRGIEIKGRPAMPDISPFYVVTSPDYFRTLGIPIRKGRTFTERDTANAPGVVVVNAAMARHFFPNQDPIGQSIKVDRLDWSTIVGVVGDVAQQALDKPPQPAVYVAYAQDPWPALGIVIRTGMDPAGIASAVIAAIHRIDKDEPVYGVRTMREVIASSVMPRRFRTILLSLFAAIALALAAIGTYGVMAYAVARRRHEIGIRLALGAQPRKVRALVIREGLQLAGYGIAVGIVISLALTRFLSRVLYGVKSTDALSFTAAVLALAGAALLASYLPARRAMKTDPADILRSE